MPKSKVRKKTDYTINPAANRTPVKVRAAGPSPVWYVAIMLGFMLAGLLWLLVYYLAAEQIGWMNDLHAWNFLIGFGLMVVGLIMTMRWR
ncbi:cell division protein CrgA [Nocardia brevicatena]|uniref:cell division protein CrgA n=1 Tax=Nocardia brevicatena TaxID=37327 RepID=UPI00030ADDFD|nr:cell division protein CrgA [Nocardia brevicatena]